MLDLYLLCIDLKNAHSNMRQKSDFIIKQIYHILNHPTPKTTFILEAWKEDFSYIYGDTLSNLSSNGKLNSEKLLEQYKITVPKELYNEAIPLLFFSIQTYFSLFVKCMMSSILNKKKEHDYSSFDELILGNFAYQHGIKNYCNPDWYCWPVFELEYGFQEIIEDIISSIEAYEKVTSFEEFVKNNNYDYIKQMYESIIPKEFRHALGEYYTPDWLAEQVLSQTANFNENIKDACLLDPTCGSGTFLFQSIAQKRKYGCSLETILQTVRGVDINPLAVLTAKTNYLLSIIDMITDESQIELPVYRADITRLEDSILDTTASNFLNCSNPVSTIKSFMESDRKKVLDIEKADIIIGNPPWVNWEYMPQKYKEYTQHLWVDYQLFCAKGRELSFSKEDISVLITYVVIDKLLKTNGILAFVIRQGVFKSAQNGAGFRRFKIRDEELQVLQVDDLSKIKVFDNAVTSTALFYLRKGNKTIYPVPYILWEKRNDLKKLSFHAYSPLREVKSQITPLEQVAIPAVEDDITSIWMTAKQTDLIQMKKVLGTNPYRARTGVFTGGANAIYWMHILSSANDEIQINNITERAKRKVKQVTAIIEKEHVYPMLKGSNVKKWKTTYDTYLLCPHTGETKMFPVSQEKLKETAPKTYRYLKDFQEELDSRKGFAGWEKEIQKQEFHAILRVGEYTFSKYKVIWKYIASEFVCAVISTVNDTYLGNKTIIPNEKIMYISTEDEMEAYYICGILSSTLIANCVKSYMNPTSISAHVLNKLNVPAFDKNNPYHMEIAAICKEGHSQENIVPYVEKIDTIIQKLYV